MSWQDHRLGDLVSLRSGGTPKKSESRYWDGKIPWLSSKDLTTPRIHDAPLHVTEEGVAHGTRLMPENTVMFVVRGMSLASEFRVSITKRPCAFNQDLKAAECNGQILPDFLFYSLFARREHIRALAGEASHGTKKLETYIVENIRLRVPDLRTQEHVIEIASTYDDLIENNRRRIALLEAAARVLYREWFVYFRFPGHEYVKIVDGIPEGWARRTLVELAEVVMGQSPKSQFYNEAGDGLPFHQGVTDYGFRFVSHRTYSTALTKLAEAGNILVSVRAPVGRINITRDKIVLGRGLASVRSRTDHQSFLFYALKNHFYAEDIIGTGAIYAATNKKELERQTLIEPHRIVLAEFEEQARDIDQNMANLTTQNEKLAQARDLLLPRLMDGEISV